MNDFMKFTIGVTIGSIISIGIVIGFGIVNPLLLFIIGCLSGGFCTCLSFDIL